MVNVVYLLWGCSLGPFSNFVGDPVLHPMYGCEHPLLYLSGTGRASQETVSLTDAKKPQTSCLSSKSRKQTAQNGKKKDEVHTHALPEGTWTAVRGLGTQTTPTML